MASSLTADGKANFVLDDSKKLTDAATYTISADWASFTTNTFMAKFAAPYAKTFEKVSNAVVAGDTGIINVSAKDQHNENVDLKNYDNSLISVQATLMVCQLMLLIIME